jgi:hypothetical protein
MKSSVSEWRKYGERYQVHEGGIILSFSKVFVASKRFAKQTPFFVAVIQLDSGKKITSHIVDVNDDARVVIGARVKPVFRKIGHDSDTAAIAYGTKFILDI